MFLEILWKVNLEVEMNMEKKQIIKDILNTQGTQEILYLNWLNIMQYSRKLKGLWMNLSILNMLVLKLINDTYLNYFFRERPLVIQKLSKNGMHNVRYC